MAGRTVGALLLLLACTTDAADWEADARAILRGVRTIGVPGVPGPLCVFGEEAFPVVLADSGGQPVPIVAAGRFGKGRVVAFGHGGYLSTTLEAADTGRLMVNAIRWAAGGTSARPRVAVRKSEWLLHFLGKEDGLEVAEVQPQRWVGQLRKFDVVVTPTVQLDEKEIRKLPDFIRSGGGLVTANLGWGWRHLNPGRDLATEHPANRLLAPMGIVWSGGFIEVPSSRRLVISGIPHRLVHAGWALDALAAEPPPGKAETALAVFTLSRCVASLPPGDALVLPRLEKLRETRGGEARLPSPQEPLTDAHALGKLLLALDLHRSRNLPPERVEPHPAAALFPGAVPADAPRVTRSLKIDPTRPGWHSTGLYAPPGEVITVRTRPPGAGNLLALRIGAHNDRLWDKKAWKRAPEITRTFALAAGPTKGANAFGGSVYIDVPDGLKRKKVGVEIAGAIEAPWFRLDETDPGRWRKEIRARPAPWAELASDKVILTVPASVVRNLDDPTDLMRFWDEVLDACADLSARPRERTRPERYVADAQLAAGYMHAGYPIMTHLDAAPRMVDARTLREDGEWGLFHEMGHNHQSRDWTFQGTSEVTCNLFTLYILEAVCTRPRAHQATSPAATLQMTRDYRKRGRDFARWKSDPFLALIMYRQLQEAFGWEAYRRVFAEYRALPASERPRNDQEKRDQWLVRFSRAVGRNLGPFFGSWGIPTSDAARRSIADLPLWMPE